MCDGYFNCPDFTDEIFCPRKLLFATSTYYILMLFIVLLLLLSSVLGVFFYGFKQVPSAVLGMTLTVCLCVYQIFCTQPLRLMEVYSQFLVTQFFMSM